MPSASSPFRRLLAPAMVAVLVLVPIAAAIGPSTPPPTDQGLPAVSQAPWGAWTATTVAGDDVSGKPSIAFTSDDRPYIQYKFSPPGDARIRVIHRTGPDEWTGHTFDVSGSNGDVTLDSQDDPHVAFARGFTSRAIFYAHRQPNGSWTKTVVDTADQDVWETSIQVNATDHPRMSYRLDNKVRYAWKTDSGWQTEIVAGGGFDNELALGPDDTPHIVYSDGADVYHAVKRDGSWQTELAQSSCVFDLSIAVDDSDTPHIACRIDDQGMAHIRKTETGAWTSTVVDDGSHAPLPRDPDNLGMPSIVLDEEGDPRIGYTYEPNFASPDTSPGQPHYAERVDGEWHVATVDRDGQDNGIGVSLALDDEGRPYLSYKRSERFEDGGGFPGSGNLQSNFDLRLARPAQAEALNLAGQ